MPTSVVRGVGVIVALLGIGMLIWRSGDNAGDGYNIVRWIHVALAIGFLGLYEASLARAKRTNQLGPDGQPLSMVGRLCGTLALLVGILLLISMSASFLGGATTVVIYLHALLGLLAVGVALAVFSRRYIKHNG